VEGTAHTLQGQDLRCTVIGRFTMSRLPLARRKRCTAASHRCPADLQPVRGILFVDFCFASLSLHARLFYSSIAGLVCAPQLAFRCSVFIVSSFPFPVFVCECICRLCRQQFSFMSCVSSGFYSFLLLGVLQRRALLKVGVRLVSVATRKSTIPFSHARPAVDYYRYALLTRTV